MLVKLITALIPGKEWGLNGVREKIKWKSGRWGSRVGGGGCCWLVEQIETDTHPHSKNHWPPVGDTHTQTHTVCGLAKATADAEHEYLSQTPWQSFHLHGPNVSSWNIYHTGPVCDSCVCFLWMYVYIYIYILFLSVYLCFLLICVLLI